jgi:signal peptidase I
MANIKKKSKKFWNFCNQDSWQSWIFCLIILILLVRFVLFPILSLSLNVSEINVPIVIIESGSMCHKQGEIGNILFLESNFESWWQKNKDWYENNNITKQEFFDYKFRTGMGVGDMVVISNRHKINVGDIIVFKPNPEARTQKPIIHRVVSITKENNQKIYSTKGDANSNQLTIDSRDRIDETKVYEEQVIGKAVMRIPRAGLLKVILSSFSQEKSLEIC